jgi:hypothetical protein
MKLSYKFKLWKLRFKKKRLQEISNLESDTLDIGMLEMKNGKFLYKTKMSGWNVTVILDILKREFFYIEDGLKQTVPINIQELLLDRLIQRV